MLPRFYSDSTAALRTPSRSSTSPNRATKAFGSTRRRRGAVGRGRKVSMLRLTILGHALKSVLILSGSGIISSLVFSPDYSGILAAGSFNGTIGLYDTTCKNVLIHLLRSEATGGITKVCRFASVGRRHRRANLSSRNSSPFILPPISSTPPHVYLTTSKSGTCATFHNLVGCICGRRRRISD